MTLRAWAIAFALAAVPASAEAPGVKHPVYPGGLSAGKAEAAAAGLAPYLEMSEAALRALVPGQSGLYWCGCPNCTAGSQEESMTWAPDDPDHVRCRYCGHVYPSLDYPATGEDRVTSPLGDEQVYRYHEDANGQRYYFEARAWYGRIHYYDGIALSLARVYAATRDQRCARAAAALVDQYARVFPGYVPKYDYPFRPKQFFGADTKPPYPVPPYRAARYYWWGYGDIPRDLVLAYDLIADSDALSGEMRQRIEDDLIRASVDWVRLNPEPLGNMSPGLWRNMIQAGRVVGEPDYVHDAVARAGRLMAEMFFYDGVWKEGAPSYHNQTVGNFAQVMDAVRGCSDPPGYLSPRDGLRFDGFDPDRAFPAYVRARAAVRATRLPNGRYAPVHDTWSKDGGEPLSESKPRLLPGMGHAVLGRGSGPAQTQVHLAFSGGYGHEHADNLSTILWANGREVFSDLGYTHTRARLWTAATAGHNTVVLDQTNQKSSRADGNLLLWVEGDLSSAVEADGGAAYPEAGVYRRLLALVGRPGAAPFIVDIFRVAGGRTHDWFLHGCADEDQSLRLSIESHPLDGDLVPGGYEFTPPKHETDWGMWNRSPALYGFLGDLRRAQTDATWHADFQSPDGTACRLTMIGAPGTEVFSGRDISIRRADEDEDRLDDFTRPFVMVRRQPGRGQSVFAAVLDPAAGERIAEVEALLVDDEAVVLQVTCGADAYLVATCANPARRVTCRSEQGAVAFRGRYGMIGRHVGSVTAQLVGATEITWGDAAFRSDGGIEGPVLAVTPETIEIEAEVADPARLDGQTVIIIHGDGTTHGYGILRAERGEPGRVRLTVPATGFEYDADNRLTRFVTFPQREIPGENRFRLDLVHEEEQSRP